MNIILELLKKRLYIRKIYKEGIGAPFFLLRYALPAISIVLFLILLEILSFKEKNILDLIKQINSLVGIILGFSIASFAIFVSITNNKLDDSSQQTTFSYREIGGSLFFYNVEVALFTSLIGIILAYMNIPILYTTELIQVLVSNSFSISLLYSIKAIKFYFFFIYIFMFFQLIFNLFYSSIFLNSSIKK